MNKIGDAQEYWIMRGRLNIDRYTQVFSQTCKTCNDLTQGECQRWYSKGMNLDGRIK